MCKTCCRCQLHISCEILCTWKIPSCTSVLLVLCVHGIMDLRPFTINGKKVKVQNKSGWFHKQRKSKRSGESNQQPAGRQRNEIMTSHEIEWSSSSTSTLLSPRVCLCYSQQRIKESNNSIHTTHMYIRPCRSHDALMRPTVAGTKEFLRLKVFHPG